MVKFKMVGDYKNARNIGNLKASVNLKNGNLVTVDRATGTVALSTATTAKKGLWLVQNEREPVEYIGSTPENIITIGEPVRLFDTATLKDVVLEIDDSVLTTDYASISKGDTLVADTKGNYEKSSDATGYEVTFTVLEKTNYCGHGLSISVNV